MTSLALQRLESLLETRKLGRTVLTAESPSLPVTRQPTGLTELDEALGGGWRHGEISELTGRRSSGRTSVVMATFAAATSAGRVVALVDAFDRFDPSSGARAGVDLDRVLWIRGPNLTLEGRPMASGGAAGEYLDRAVHQAIRAFDLVLRAGGFAVAVLDLADVPLRAIRALPFTTWMRLAHANEGRQTVGLLTGEAPMGRSARGATVRLEPSTRWMGTSPQASRFAGFEIHAHVNLPGNAGRACQTRLTWRD